ncbi:MAG: D-alanyl-D-alanine carboxypeptidase [Paracoccaceae bacterium]
MVRQALCGVLAVLIFQICAPQGQAAPHAALVMDARNGRILYEKNADRRLHPASLTKMMTLYIVFQEIEAGRLSLNQKVRITRAAAARPASRLGLKTGQKVTIRDLVRGAAVKSANDAATALAVAVSGSESAFARKMTETAKAMGLNRTTFRNASGLTQNGHLSSARDMALLGRRLFFDFPDYYNLFSRRTTVAARRTVYNTNRKFLAAYRGADGIKTGYTAAAGYNLVASARRGRERIIAVVFGARSTSARNAEVARLLDLGFRKAPGRVAVVPPERLRFPGDTVLASSPRPRPRPVMSVVAMARNVAGEAPRSPGDSPTSGEMAAAVAGAIEAALVEDSRVSASVPPVSRHPRPRRLTARRIAAARPAESGAGNGPASPSGKWSVQLGAFSTRSQAERLLLKTALQDLESFDGALRTIVKTQVRGTPMYRARFVGLSRDNAQKACARLKARASQCTAIAPGS